MESQVMNIKSVIEDQKRLKMDLRMYLTTKNSDGLNLFQQMAEQHATDNLKHLIRCAKEEGFTLEEIVEFGMDEGRSILHLSTKDNLKYLLGACREQFPDKLKGLLNLILLHTMAARGRKDPLMYLISYMQQNNLVARSPIKATDGRGFNLLHTAVRRRQLDTLKCLVNSLNTSDERWSILTEKTKHGHNLMHLCVLSKDTETFRYLLGQMKAGRSDIFDVLREKTSRGNNLLHLAIIGRGTEMLTELVECFKEEGVNMPEVIKEKNCNGNNVLHLSITINLGDMLRLLVGLIQHDAADTLKEKNDKGLNVLEMSIERRDMATVEYLLGYFRELSPANMRFLLKIVVSDGYMDTLNFLLDSFDNNNVDMKELLKGRQGADLLHLALDNDDFATVRSLLERFAKFGLNTVDLLTKPKGGNLLKRSVSRGNLELVSYLMSHLKAQGVDAKKTFKDSCSNSKNVGERNLIRLASTRDDKDVLKYLLLYFIDEGVDVNDIIK